MFFKEKAVKRMIYILLLFITALYFNQEIYHSFVEGFYSIAVVGDVTAALSFFGDYLQAFKFIHIFYLLPVISNQRFNSYLKEIAIIVGIEKRLTHHTARKTFASTVLLYNNVPMEIVSELLGHSNMSITQEYYGKVVMKKVSDEIKKLNGRI